MAINVPAIALARGVVAPDNREVLWEDTSNMNLPFYERVKAYDSNSNQWRMVTQFPLELLNELRKVDGDGSGLDANFLQGRTVNDIIQLAKDGSFTLPSGFIFIGDTLGNATPRALSGDATLQNTGALILAASGVTAGTYNLATVTVDAKGRVTGASSYTITVDDIPELPQSKITNLVTDLGNKQATLVSGVNIKTINSQSLLGAGDFVLPPPTWGNITGTLSAQTDLNSALGGKEPTITAGTTGQYYRGDKTFQTLDKTAVGLSNVDNTSDVNKPVSTAQQTEINTKNIFAYDDTDVSPLTRRTKYRAVEYIEFEDDAINSETKIQLRADSVTPSEVTRFGENGSGNVDLKIQENKLLTGTAGGFAIELTFAQEGILGLDVNNEVKEFEVVEIYNILKENAVTGNKQLALLDINGNSANVKAKFEISAIAVQNTTANAVTINIGSTALGTDVVNAFALGASETKKLPLGTTFFSITSGQNLFISSGSWNSASINIHVTINKIWQ